jgi:predicted glycogen debranching enzyme
VRESLFDFGREVCGSLEIAGRREWLITNGLGGYASGTIAGLLTRRYHGLLVASLDPPVARTLLLTRLDETVVYDGRVYPLFTNCWESGVEEPAGYRYLERFRLEGTTPVWTFACGDALLEKRVWMRHGANTTCVRYDLIRATELLAIDIKVMVNYRDHHSNTHAGWEMEIESVARGLRLVAFDGAIPLYLLSRRAEVSPRHEWYRGYFLSQEAYRGLDALDDNLYAGLFRATLRPGESLTLVAGTDGSTGLDEAAAYAEKRAREERVLLRSGRADAPDWLQHLVLAADQFVVRRPLPDEPEGCSVIAGYPWFADRGRDAMISLPGLLLATGRYDDATRVLRTFARFVDQGMLLDRFPDAEGPPVYAADAALWFLQAVHAAYATSLRLTGSDLGDDGLVRDLYPVLSEIVERYAGGTRYGIRMDPADGLLYAGEPGVQLTWMDARVDDRAITPRAGKAVEINALWYNGLRVMVDLARLVGESPDRYRGLAEEALGGFARFWSGAAGYCYDVLDGPDGDDLALRPNQILAVSLPHSPLTARQQRAVVGVCARHLLTSHGLRSLAPGEPAYVGRYGGDRQARDRACHQGTVWAWLIGSFVEAYLRVAGDRETARAFLRPLVHQMVDHGVGSLGEIYDGDAPFAPRGCIARAWSVAEVLRAWELVASDGPEGRGGRNASGR